MLSLLRRTAEQIAHFGAAATTLGAAAFLFFTHPGWTLPPPAAEVLLLASTAGAFITLLALAMALRSGLRWACLLATPVLVVPLILGILMIPVAADLGRVTLRDGRVLHLGLDVQFTDRSYSLWEERAGGLYWRRLNVGLSYSEDGSFVGGEELRLSRDGRRLLVRRGGVWTDCLDVERAMAACAGLPEAPDWFAPDAAPRMRRNSDWIAAHLL